MKLLETNLEARTLKTICDGDKRVSSYLLSSVDASYFYNESCLEAYNRVMTLVKSRGKVPGFFEVCADPIISETSRKFLKKKKPLSVKSKGRAISLVESLLRYRRLRELYFMYEDGQKALLKEKVDLEKLIEDNADSLTKAKSRAGIRKEILNIGNNSNTKDIVKRLLGKNAPPVIPTGFKGWDDKNGGLNLGNLMIVAATSGGGKSAVSNQMLLNMSSCGYNTCLVALEMSEEECLARICSNLASVDVTKYTRRKTSFKEAKRTRIRLKKYERLLREKGCRYSIMSPEEDVSIDEVLFTLKPYDYEVIIIDYAGLLAGMDTDDQWRRLGAVARQCKNFSRINNVSIVLLAQLSEEGMIRYSKAMKEHADVMWSWTYSEKNRETGMLYIVPQKSRNQDPTPFELWHDFRFMQVRDPTDGERMNSASDEKADKKRKKHDKTVKDMEDYLSV